jgi:acyl-CoA synthetase (AMP-forming)/AMP-acid ligase II
MQTLDYQKEGTVIFDWSKVFDPARIGIANNARRAPNRPACVVDAQTVTYAELDRDINALAHALQGLGLKPGDNIAALFHNGHKTFTAWGAAAKIKATSLALNYKLKENELAYILEDSQCKLLMYDDEFEPLIRLLEPKLTGIAPIKVCSGATPATGGYRFEELIVHCSAAPIQVGEPSGIIPPTLAYTSGTTGRPKGVYRHGGNRLAYLLLQAHLFGSGFDDVHLAAGPLYHAAPFGWSAFSLLLGNTVVIMPKFDAENFLQIVEQWGVTTTFMVPTMMHRILNLPDEKRGAYDISSLRCITVAGEPFPLSMKKKCIDYFGEGKLFEFYGGTELGVVTYIRPEDQLRKPASCGRPLDGIQIAVLDEDRREVPTGTVGILYVKSPYLLDGYHKNPEATSANFYDGYFTIGDMGYVDDDGYYYIVDRAVDMIISGGVNIYPAEIEEVLYRHPCVAAATVIGAPDPAWGEKIVAIVVPKRSATPDAREIIDFVAANLAAYKKPREIIFVDALPTSATGKILKRELRRTYLQSSDQQASSNGKVN